MIEKLKIQNFQSHKNSELNFDKGVNMIIGSSDSGKTAIIRALRLLIWNKPGGDAFRSNWGGKTLVELTTIENDKITRTKDKAENSYICNGQIYKAFGTDIPEDIKKILNINAINCQQQLDSPFLLTETPGGVAKHFNKIAHLEQIDSSQQVIEKWLRSIKRDSEANEKRELQLNTELESFEHLQKFEIDVEELERQDKKLIEKRNKLRKLITLKNNIIVIENDLKEKSKILKFEKPVNEILNLYNQKKEKKQIKYKLEKLTIQGIKIRKELKDNKRIIRAEKSIDVILNLYNKKKEKKNYSDKLFLFVEKINTVQTDLKEKSKILKLETPINNILNLYNKKKEKKDIKNKLNSFVVKIDVLQNDILNYTNKYKRLKETFKNNFPDICPLCGQTKPKKL